MNNKVMTLRDLAVMIDEILTIYRLPLRQASRIKATDHQVMIDVFVANPNQGDVVIMESAAARLGNRFNWKWWVLVRDKQNKITIIMNNSGPPAHEGTLPL